MVLTNNKRLKRTTSQPLLFLRVVLLVEYEFSPKPATKAPQGRKYDAVLDGVFYWLEEGMRKIISIAAVALIATTLSGCFKNSWESCYEKALEVTKKSADRQGYSFSQSQIESVALTQCNGVK